MTRNEQLQDIIVSAQQENARLALVIAKLPRPRSVSEQRATDSIRRGLAKNHDVMRNCREQLQQL